MKKSKILAVSAAAMVLTSVCVSCGDKKTKDEKQKASEEEVTTVAEADADEAEEADDAEDETESTDEKITEADDSDDEDSDDTESEIIDINDYIDEGTPSPALWKVTDPETGNELYMMGTIHIVSVDTFPLPDYIMDVYNNCDGVAVEYDTNTLTSDMDLYKEYLMGMAYTDGTTIKDHISGETYEKISAALAELTGMDSMVSAFDAYKPGMWLSLMESYTLMNFRNMDANGVDANFISLAEKDGKEVVNIETLDIQTNAITGFSDELADYMLSETADELADVSEFAQSFADMYNHWAEGNIDALMDDEEEDDIPSDLEDDYADYMDTMLYNRNRGMAEKAEEFLKNGDNYFFMVGGLHFAGDRGVDDLLAEMGYIVEQVK